MEPIWQPPIPGSFDCAMDHSPQLTEEDDENQSPQLDWTSLIQRIEQTSGAAKYSALQSLHAQLIVEDRRGHGRTDAIEQRVDRCLCLEIMQCAPDSSDTETLVITLQSLALLWTKQSTRRRESRVRGLEVLPYLISLWKVAPRMDLRIAMAILSIFRPWAKTQDALVRTHLIKMGMVKAVSVVFETNEGNSPLWPSCLGLMKDLMFRAKFKEKETMYEEWMDHVIKALPNDDCVEAATACLWNWAVEEEIALRMANHVRMWASISLCQPTFKSLGTSLGAEKNTLSAVGSILSVCTSRLEEAPSPVASHSPWMINFLVENLEAEQEDLRRRAVRSIRCLSSCAWGREMLKDYFGNTNGLWQRLTRLLVNRDEQDDTRVQVCLAMNNWLPHLHDNWSQVGPYLERSLVKVIQDKESTEKVIWHSMQVLTTCFEFSPWKRGAGCLSKDFFIKVHDVLKDHITNQDYHDLVVAFLCQVTRKTNYDANQPVLADEKVVDILALLLSQFENATIRAVHVIKEATKHEETRKHFVGNDTLLTNLVNVCIVSSGDRKAEAKSLLVSLVSEL